MSTELIEVTKAVAEFDRVALGLAELNKQYANVVYEVATAKGMDEAKVARAAIREPRYEVERIRKAAKAPILALGKKLDGEAARITAELEKLELPIDTAIKSEEARKERDKQEKIAAELKRVEDLQARVIYLNGNHTVTSLWAPDVIAEHISDLEAEVVDESFEEFQERAATAKATGIARLQALHAASVERVAEAARIKAEREELAQLREQQAEQNRKAQAERDAEAARQQAEAAAERERIAAEDRAAKVKRDAEAAELKAAQAKAQTIIDAENARVAAENKAIADKLAADRAELERRQADERKAKADEEARRAEQARIAALVRPSDEEMIDVLAIHYNAPASRIVEWLLSIDFSSDQLKELAAA